MGKDPTEALHDGLALGSWGVQELWIAMFGLGGNLTTDALEAIIVGTQEPSRREYTLLQLALNERLEDLGLERSVAAWPQLPDLPSPGLP